MGPFEAIKTRFAKSFQFSGRASRSEFVIQIIFAASFASVAGFVSYFLLDEPALVAFFSFLVAIFLTIPTYVRRLRDINISGLWILLFMVTPLAAPFFPLALPSPAIDMGLSPYVFLSSMIFLAACPFALVMIALFALIPGKHHHNKYDPTPNEVPS